MSGERKKLCGLLCADVSLHLNDGKQPGPDGHLYILELLLRPTEPKVKPYFARP